MAARVSALDNYEKSLATLRQMDRLGFLINQLFRGSELLKDVAASNSEGQKHKPVTFLQLQSQFDNYYHFIVEIAASVDSFISNIERVKNDFATDPEAAIRLEQIEQEFGLSHIELINNIENLEGPELLAWVHPIRYRVSTSAQKAEDLYKWVKAQQYMKTAKKHLAALHYVRSNTWPELGVQANLLLERLEKHFEIEWSKGKGKRAEFISNKLAEKLKQMSELDAKVDDLFTSTSTDIRQLRIERSSEVISDLVEEYNELKSRPGPRINWLARQSRERLRKARINNRFDQLNEKRLHQWGVTQPYDENTYEVIDVSTTWLQKLAQSFNRMSFLHKTSVAVVDALQSITQLTGKLNFRQRGIFKSLKESLTRHMISSSMQLNQDIESILYKITRYSQRFRDIKPATPICAVCGGSFLSSDVQFNCPDCFSTQHEDCLTNGRCALCVVIATTNSESASHDVQSDDKRLPVYFLLDYSESMNGAPFQSLRSGVTLLINELRKNQFAAATVLISVIYFNNKVEHDTSLMKIADFKFDTNLKLKGSGKFGEALKFLNETIGREIFQSASADETYFKPNIFVLSNGRSQSDGKLDLDRFKYLRASSIVAIGCGNNVNVPKLREITDEVARMQDITIQDLQQYFKWLPLPSEI